MSENVSTTQDKTGLIPYKTLAFDQFITFKALGGMMVDDDGNIDKMTLGQFCAKYGVDERTTWRWKAQTPDFAQLVIARRREIMPHARISAAWNRMYMIGMSSLPTRQNPTTGKLEGSLHGDQRAAVDALKTFLSTFDEVQNPTQRQEVKVEHTIGDIFARTDEIIEGELIHGGDDLGGGEEMAATSPRVVESS